MRLYRMVTAWALALVLLPSALFFATATDLPLFWQAAIVLAVVLPPLMVRRLGAAYGVLALATLLFLCLPRWPGILLGVFTALGAVVLMGSPILRRTLDLASAKRRHSLRPSNP